MNDKAKVATQAYSLNKLVESVQADIDQEAELRRKARNKRKARKQKFSKK